MIALIMIGIFVAFVWCAWPRNGRAPCGAALQDPYAGSEEWSNVEGEIHVIPPDEKK